MVGDVKKLSNEVPIILTWVPRVHGASLPDGENSKLNYLEIITNHKSKNKEERDIYLVINGPGFEENQIDYLKHVLEDTKGVHVIDLHQYDWSEIDTGWKIDGKDISIKDFFKNMYNISEEQRTYFAVEIDTFRLVALSLLKQFTEHEGGIYIDFDSLYASGICIGRSGRVQRFDIGRDIKIPMGILLGDIRGIHTYNEEECDPYYGYLPSYNNAIEIEDFDNSKVTKLCANNDCIVIDSSNIVVDILSLYKDKILTQKAMCQKIEETLLSVTEAELDAEFSLFIHKKEFRNAKIKDRKKNFENCLAHFQNYGIKALYNTKNFHYIVGKFNLAQESVVTTVRQQLIGKEVSKCKLFSFSCNNGNYLPSRRSDLSWIIENDLYHAEGNLEEPKVDQIAMRLHNNY